MLIHKKEKSRIREPRRGLESFVGVISMMNRGVIISRSAGTGTGEASARRWFSHLSYPAVIRIISRKVVCG